jgi:hypothetical protein
VGGPAVKPQLGEGRDRENENAEEKASAKHIYNKGHVSKYIKNTQNSKRTEKAIQQNTSKNRE